VIGIAFYFFIARKIVPWRKMAKPQISDGHRHLAHAVNVSDDNRIDIDRFSFVPGSCE